MINFQRKENVMYLRTAIENEEKSKKIVPRIFKSYTTDNEIVRKIKNQEKQEMEKRENIKIENKEKLFIILVNPFDLINIIIENIGRDKSKNFSFVSFHSVNVKYNKNFLSSFLSKIGRAFTIEKDHETVLINMVLYLVKYAKFSEFYKRFEKSFPSIKNLSSLFNVVLKYEITTQIYEQIKSNFENNGIFLSDVLDFFSQNKSLSILNLNTLLNFFLKTVNISEYFVINKENEVVFGNNLESELNSKDFFPKSIESFFNGVKNKQSQDDFLVKFISEVANKNYESPQNINIFNDWSMDFSFESNTILSFDGLSELYTNLQTIKIESSKSKKRIENLSKDISELNERLTLIVNAKIDVEEDGLYSLSVLDLYSKSHDYITEQVKKFLEDSNYKIKKAEDEILALKSRTMMDELKDFEGFNDFEEKTKIFSYILEIKNELINIIKG
jgi:hypothetical protein